MRLTCKACWFEHDPRVRCDQAKRLRDGQSQQQEVEGKVEMVIRPAPELAPRQAKEPAPDAAVKIARTANRRTREAFNAYQREYMKSWRARQK